METKHLRPILTAKEPKNKNVLWCHDGKISYYDKEWKDVSGGSGSSEITELSTDVFQDTLKKFADTPIYFYDRIEISSNIIITPFGINVSSKANIDYFNINVSSYTDFILHDYGISFQFRTGKPLLMPIEENIGDFMFVSKYDNGRDILNDMCLVLSTFVLNDISTKVHLINFSTLIRNPIGVSNPTDASKWTLTDCQNILKGLKDAGYFLSTRS